jgi:hypothetical protein
MHDPFSIRALAFFLAAVIAVSGLEAKEKEQTIRPSFAKPVRAVVFQGGEVRIPLGATTPVGGTKYLVRSLPSKGRLGEVVVTEDGQGSVVYRHGGGGIGEDSFTYAVQLPGAAVSSRATVSIRVINRPARVVAPEEVDFGSVPVGASSRRVLVLKNPGGEKFSGRLVLPAPWTCDRGRVEVSPGGSLELAVDFSPDGVREYSGTYLLDGAGGTTGLLTGGGYVVFEVSTKQLKLLESADGSRSAELSVANKTADPLTVAFECPPEIRAIPPLTIPPGESASAMVVAADSQNSGVRSGIVLRESRVSATVEVAIPPAPARLLSEPATAVDFGDLAPGSSAAREMSVTNAGGVAAAVELGLPPWIRADPDRALVKPGERRTFRIEAVGARPGDLRDRIVLKSDAGSVELVVTAKVRAPAAPTPAQASATPLPPSFQPLQPLQITRIAQGNGTVVVRWVDPNPEPHTIRVESLRITSQSSLARQAVLALNVDAEKFRAEEFAAERLRLGQLYEKASKDDRIVKIWSPLEKMKIGELGNRTFEVSFPMPGDPVVRIRILMVFPDGVVSDVVSEIRIPLQHPKPPGPPLALIALGLVGLIALVTLFVRRYRVIW